MWGGRAAAWGRPFLSMGSVMTPQPPEVVDALPTALEPPPTTAFRPQ